MSTKLKAYHSYISWVLGCVFSRHLWQMEDAFIQKLTEWGDYVYDVLFSDIKSQRVAGYCSSVFIKSVAGTGLVISDAPCRFREVGFFVRFSHKRPLPDFVPPNVFHLADFDEFCFETSPCLVLYDHPVWYGLRDELVAYNKKRKETEEKFSKMYDYVENLCDYYETVGEVLAAWPAFKFLLPYWVEEDEFRFSGTPKPLPEGVGVAELTAMIVRAKLTKE